MSTKKSYRQLREELDKILHQLESENIDIDEALIQHKKGQEVLKQMEQYLSEVSQVIEPKEIK